MKQLPNNWQILVTPTDTVYGIVAKVSAANIDKIYKLKERDRSKPLILFVADLQSAKQLWRSWSETHEQLAQYWPGALTLISERSNIVPAFVNPEHQALGIRIPDSPIIMELLKQTEDSILLSTSANLSGEAEVQTYEEALELFDGKVDAILQNPQQKLSQTASTIVKIEEDGSQQILRQGGIQVPGTQSLLDKILK